MSSWNINNIEKQEGKVFLITGATSGLGKEAARVLTKKGGTVIMAIRNLRKGQQVIDEIQKEVPQGIISMKHLDLSSLVSIQKFVADFLLDFDRLDVLINNAGVMMCPYSKTEDGFEIQMGVNHFGHFALTGLLMPILRKTKESRIVVTSSIAHKFGGIDFSDINWEKRRYNSSRAYGDSKIANLYFTYELAERYKNDPDAPCITAAHPGWTKTELQRHTRTAQFLNNFFAQKVDIGTLPTLRAAVDPRAKSGDYYGPKRFFEMWGAPIKVSSNRKSRDKAAAKKLWDLSVELTGVVY
ncbi:MAG: oxidoreductase [Saprospiraceae bacterium]|nr:oxidoreductase [Saprospiraceae bacterium]